MKHCFLISFFLLVGTSLISQNNTKPITNNKWDLDKYVWSHTHLKPSKGDKPPIDTDAIDKWPSVGNAAISNDGKYVAYVINNQPVGSNTLVIQATEGNWKKEFTGAENGFFSGDSK